MKKLLALMLVLVAVAGCSCAEPEKVQAIKFVPIEEAPRTAKKPR